MDFLTVLYWLSLNCFHEARGEPQLGQVYVARTVLNRAEKTGMSIKEVVNASDQFSWTTSEIGQRPIDEPKSFLKCVDSSIISIDFELNPDITHYHKKTIRPYWAKKYKLVATIGKHKFYQGEYDHGQSTVQ